MYRPSNVNNQLSAGSDDGHSAGSSNQRSTDSDSQQVAGSDNEPSAGSNNQPWSRRGILSCSPVPAAASSYHLRAVATVVDADGSPVLDNTGVCLLCLRPPSVK